MPSPLNASDLELLATLQRDTFDYFLQHAHPTTGLIADSTEPGSPASIAATGFGLTTCCVAAERGWLSRSEAAAKALRAMRFFQLSAQGDAPDATGHHGLYYHFLDMASGRRAWSCEISTIDSAFLIAGMLTAGEYFVGDTADEREIRALADALYRRAEWTWFSDAEGTLGHGWTPEREFLNHAWDRGYSEAMVLYVLALGSPTFPISERGYRKWTATFERKTFYGLDCLYAGPLFIHQLSQIFLDLRALADDRNREVGWTYFENSRRATLVQQQYGIENPQHFVGYSANNWGLTASDGPGPAVRIIDGVRREFQGYIARGAPLGPDDGTLAPWAVVASLPFAPEPVCDTIRHAVDRLKAAGNDRGGFDASFNPTFVAEGGSHWRSPWRLGLNDGPIVLMIENHLSQLTWRTFMRSPSVAKGLDCAGFRPLDPATG